jgi:molybdate transport system substrate-binding protein
MTALPGEHTKMSTRKRLLARQVITGMVVMVLGLASIATAAFPAPVYSSATQPSGSAQTGTLRADIQSGVTLTVSAASDLTPVFAELGPIFTAETGIELEFNFGSTGQLTQQIIAGAPVDVFAAANVDYIDQLDEQGLILPDTQAMYARGRITLWTRSDSEIAINDLSQLTDPGVERIAVANPDHAPYGVAAREAMQSAGVWDAVQEKLILGENISDTLRLAQTGNVDVAIIALSLSIGSEGNWTPIEETLHEPIDQALAVVASTEHEPEARAFALFVNSDQGREIMRRYGFVLPGEELAPGTPTSATPVATPIS